MGLTACQNDFEEQIEAKDSVVVTFVADSAESRTSVDTSGDDKPVFSWDADETFAVLEQTDKLAGATSVEFAKDEESGTATITATFDNNSGKGAYRYVTVYPESGYVEAESIESATLSVSANQTMYSAGTYDPNADLMVSMVVEATEQPTEVQPVRFTRLVAVAEMTLKNFELEDGDVIKSVTFTAEGKTIAGTITSNLTAPYEGFEAKAGVSSVSVDIPEEGFDSKVYFTLLPTTLAEGEKYTVAIVTEKYLYAKTGEIPEGKSLAFEAGNVTRFGANMSGVAKGDKWVLVRDASELNSGDVVTFAAKNSNRVMGCTYSGSYPYASYTEIIKVGDYLYHPIEVNANNQRIQHLVLASRGEGFDIYNGVDYDGDSKTGYLYASNSSHTSFTSGYLKLQAYPDNNTLFYISIADNGVATIQAKDSEYTNNCVRYYNNSSYHYFQLWNEITDETAVCLYKLEGAEPAEIPVPGANITVSNSSTALVIEKEGVQEETHLEKVTFNYVGDWDIEVSAKERDSEEVADWLTLTYENSAITYTVKANEGIVRYATVTITATHAGEDDIVKSFEVVQKGAPQEISLAEFVGLSADPNVEYIITGRISSLATSKNGTYKITDGTNEASISYLYQEGNVNAVYENIDLKVGDVITVCTASTGSGKGGSSSAHAIYKGYYNISVEEPAEVAYTGGNATITINKVGTLIPEEEFGGDLDVESDVATLTLPEGDSTEATVTFTQNNGYARQAVATLTYGLATIDVTIVQSPNTDPLKKMNWVLVEDASTLKETDIVAIVAQDYDKALSTTIASSRRSATDATKVGKYLVPSNANAIQEFVLVNGTESGTFAFYDEANEGFIASTSTSTGSSAKLLNQAFNDENSSYKVTITEGVTTIGNVAGTYSTNVITYSTSYNFYSAKTASKAVCLYRLVGVSGTVPVVKADVTANNVTISEDATAVETPINTVVFNYVDGWNFSVEESADWLTVAYDEENTCLTYTATENTGVVRDATVRIIASRDGQDDIEWTFTILQKGAPMEVSIEEFLTKEVSADIVYKLTGKVKTISNSNSGTYTLEDGNGNNTVEIRYLYFEGGTQKVYDSDVLKVGDIVTVNAVVATKGSVGGSSVNRAIYKGRYRVDATAGAVGSEGGTATINVSVNKDGVIDAPTTISSSEVSADGVTYSFTDNNDGTATANLTFTANTTNNVRSASVTFTAGMYSTSITVMQDVAPATKAGGWWLVLDADELQAGDQIIIAATGMDYAISTATNSTVRKPVAITKNGGALENVSESVQQYALEIDANDLYSFKGTLGTDANKYIYAASSSYNYMKVSSTLDNNGRWTIAIEPDGTATIIAQGTYTRNVMQYNNKATSEPNFYCTDGSQGAVCLYKYYE